MSLLKAEVLSGPSRDSSGDNGPPTVRRRALRVREPSSNLILAVVAAVPLMAVLALLLGIVWISIQTTPSLPGGGISLGSYRELFDARGTAIGVARNTIQFVIVATAVAGVFGITIAWLVGRTTLPGKNLIRTLMTLSVILPGYMTAMGWVFLFHPRIGTLSNVFDMIPLLEGFRVSLANPIGMGVVQGMSLAPLFFIILVEPFRSADPSLEEAARAHGLSPLMVAFKVTLPLLLPSLLAAAFYTSMIAAAAFDVPAVIGLSGGVYTISTWLYTLLEPGAASTPAYGLTAVIGVTLAAATVIPIILYVRLLSRSYKYGTISGKGYRLKGQRLSRRGVVLGWVFIGLYVLMAQLLPIVNTIWVSLQPFAKPITLQGLETVSLDTYRNLPWRQIRAGLRNTAILMTLAPTLAVFFSLTISWTVVRSRFRLRGAYDVGAFIPLAVPNVVFATSMLFGTLFIVPRSGLYGTLLAILIVYVVSHISFATRNLNGVLVSINRELEEVASAHGISPWTKLSRVVLPLLLPTVASTWMWLALLSYRELTVATFLATRDNVTLPSVIWSTWNAGGAQLSATITTVGFLVMIPLIAAYWSITNRTFSRVEES